MCRLQGQISSSSAFFAKMLCLNGKIREGQSRLPGDPLSPPKRDSQAFAESSANVDDVAHRGRRCRANSQPRCIGVQYASISQSTHSSTVGCASVKHTSLAACRLYLLLRRTRYRRTILTRRRAKVLSTSQTHRSRRLIAPYCAHSMLESREQ